jgi:hypothetical protein
MKFWVTWTDRYYLREPWTVEYNKYTVHNIDEANDWATRYAQGDRILFVRMEKP